MTPEPPPRAHLVERAVEAMSTGRAPAPEPRPPLPKPEPRPQAPAAAIGVLEAPPERKARVAEPVPMALLRQAGLAFAPDTAPRSRVSEELTLVQQQLLRSIAAPSQPGRPNVGRHTVLITSARRGEGKSFVSLNLACSIASSTSHQVVLVDVDGFGSSLTEALNLRDEPGLRALAANPSQPKEPLLRSTAIERLSILPHGASLPGNPAPPAGAAMAAAVRALAVAMPHHIIILDTPPALSTSDAHALAAVVGQVVVVVQAEEIPRDEVEATLDVVEACPSLHLLLNQTRFTASDSFGAYGAYAASHRA